MHIREAMKLLGLAAALVVLILVVIQSEQAWVAQADCAIIVRPGQSIQQAIDQAQAGAVVCLSPGTFQENIGIKKSLTLRGAGRNQTVIEGKVEESQREPSPPGVQMTKPVVRIESASEIDVSMEGLTIAEAKGSCYSDSCFVEYGISVGGHAKVTIRTSVVSRNGVGLAVGGSAHVSLTDSQISDNAFGLNVWDSAQVSLTNSQVSHNFESGLYVGGSARVSLTSSTISGSLKGLMVEGLAQVSLTDSQVSNNNFGSGLYVGGSAQVSLTGSTIFGNRQGLVIEGSARAEVRQSLIAGNGTNPEIVDDCRKADVLCNGIVIGGEEARLTLIDSIITANADWGLATELTQCGGYVEGSFTGKVEFQGANVIKGNNKSGNHNGKGNPGNHPFKSLSDGQVCLL